MGVSANAVPVCYETLCDPSAALWQRLVERLALTGHAAAHPFHRAQHEVSEPADPALQAAASDLQQQLRAAGEQALQ